MGKASSQKKARRQKRQAKRVAWDTFLSVMDEIVNARDVADVILGIGQDIDDDWPDEVLQLLAQAMAFDERITKRGWVFDSEESVEGLAVWYFPQSGFEPDDDDVEAVTRVFFATEDFPESVSLMLVGSGLDDTSLVLPVDRFFDKLDAIEAYREMHATQTKCESGPA